MKNKERKDSWALRLQNFFDVCQELQARKRNDYTGKLHPLHNYTKSGEAMGVSTGLSMLGRMQEKVIRLSLLLQGTESQVTDESRKDTYRDIAILAALLYLWDEDEEVEKLKFEVASDPLNYVAVGVW